MKVAMIGHKQMPSRAGGVEIVVESLSEQLVKMGTEVDVYNRKDKNFGRIKEYKGIHIYTVFTINSKSLEAIVATFFATLKAMRRPYDVLHYHAEGPCLMLWLPHLFRRHTVVTIHGLDWKRAKWGNLATKMLLLGERFAAEYADEIIVLSENVKEYFLQKYNREAVYIPNGIQNPVIRKPSVIKDLYGLEKESYILFLARIVPEKGLHYLIEAYNKINTDKKLVIAGDCKYAEEYGEKIEKMCEENKNIVLTGFVEGEALYELFSNAVIYVLPSEIEGMAMSLLEAMSYGRCCLVSNIPENMAVAEGYAESFQVTDVKDLRKKLQELLESPERRSYLGEHAKEYVLKNYNWSQIAKKTLKAYENK